MVDKFTIRSIALKWYFFTSASLMVYDEFFNLFMKQLGLTSQQIGATTLLGVQHLFIPLLLLIGDKFRARKLLVWIVTIVAVINCILPLLPLVVDLPTCFQRIHSSIMASAKFLYPNHPSRNATSLDNGISFQATSVYNSTTKNHQTVPWISNIFFLMAMSRALTAFLEGTVHALANLATITHLDKHRSSFGSYYMWSQIGSGVSILTAAVLSWIIRLAICGKEGYGFFSAFLVASFLVVLSMFALPWFEFKYENDRTIDWGEVKRVVTNSHYIYMYFMFFYAGVCVAFQIYWEFWYLDELLASPLIMGGAALIRRPLLAVSIFTSCRVIRKIGDLYTICIAFLLFALSYFALSFTRVFWYVLAIDTFQAAAYGLSYTAFTVHLSKAGSKASSGILLGKNLYTSSIIIQYNNGVLLYICTFISVPF
jgi:MFS family permease